MIFKNIEKYLYFTFAYSFPSEYNKEKKEKKEKKLNEIKVYFEENYQ